MREWKDIVDGQAIRQALEKTHWAGRLECIRPQIYLDGAHNSSCLDSPGGVYQRKRAGRLSSSNPILEP